MEWCFEILQCNHNSDLRTLPQFRSLDNILNDALLKRNIFDSFRHDKGKFDRLRTIITKITYLVSRAAEDIAQAAVPVCGLSDFDDQSLTLEIT